ncbi:MAG: cysteine sulfinate desulfinase [Ignavibacteria bacterium GWB2_35_12]|nr:MAG: cysteine sulfinate desulfinase [Ignavibacteria bacterium GWA2_35_8]OGU40312.1 MAG: cysteine sulfinate desulfinase [Ignavibacteria bacterium GWB2_35_12]OGU93048.1 MAG: cysteine sulfinate desulfinase [Ignavibacteria bacterium RIFOXYA2_FULL_35_10]OGV24740.1 MAG: cysteine sulfinate desulfinase [Ignavibacteria bacterium RIFOXYC2_FULL_35_21]
MQNFDVNKIRQDFPILSKMVNGKTLVYFDNAATTQKPLPVIEKLIHYYTNLNSNVHRGVHYLSEAVSKEYEDTRKLIQNFIYARSPNEIIFTRGTTESINLVASSYGRTNIKEGDEVLITHMEHHSNIVPWQLLCEEKGAKLKVVPITDDGELMLSEYDKLINEKTKFVSVVHISNSLGTVNPIKKIIEKAHRYNIPVLVDAAQSIQHSNINVQELDCDFLAFSGHKIYGPTGIGILYGKKELLEKMPPYQGGGDMILSVTFEKTLFNTIPYKFEAGTPHIAGVLGLSEAIKYIQEIGIENIASYESEVLKYATEAISEIKEVKIIGTAKEKSSILSFVIDGIHPHDIGTFLDRDGVAIRTGHHCTEPIMRRFNVPATSRASFAFYNLKEEVDVFVKSLRNVIKLFS